MPALAGRHRMHQRLSNMLRGPPLILRHVFSEAFDHDAPPDPQLPVPIVHFEGELGLGDVVELGARSRAEHHDLTFHRVVDWKDLWLPFDTERHPTEVP